MENKAKMTADIFPDCWKDDVRMNSLFAPFRKRSANPLDWDSKLKFWKSLIERWCFHNKKPVFTVSEVTAAFERNGRRALCLPVVVGEILRSGEGCLLSEFEKGSPPEDAQSGLGSWAGWAVGLVVKKPLQWAVGRFVGSEEQVDPEEPIVLLSVLKNISDEMLDSGSAEVADLNDLQRSALSKENARLGLLMLQRRGLAASATCGKRTLVKLAPEKGKVGAEGEVAISEMERSAYVLREDELVLRNNIEKLEEEKARLTEEAREYVRKGMRQLAKSSLRKRHAVEQCIEKRVQALENIQSLLHRVKEAETDGQVLESYKIGVAALKKTLSEAGLTEDNVESTKAELEDVLELHGDLANALSELGKMGSTEGEEEELEDELAQLLGQPTTEPSAESLKSKGSKDDEWEKDVEKRLKSLTYDDLPSPPIHEPVTPPMKVSSKMPSQLGQ